MRPLSSGFVLAIALGILGCGSQPASTPAKAAVPRGKPAFVRLVNLTDSQVTANIGNIYRDESVSPFEMSSSRPVSPQKTLQVKVVVANKELSIDVKTEPETFATVVVSKDGLTTFNSGKSLSDATSGKIDLVNLTGKPVQFKVENESPSVPPMGSLTFSYPVGGVKVSLAGADSVDIELGKAQIWAAYVFLQDGKIVLRTANLKGTGSAVGTGPAAS